MNALGPIRLGLVGVGAIARAQHLPVIAASSRFELVAAASRQNTADGAPTYADLDEMLRKAPDIQAVSLCTPPAVRFADAWRALDAGRHVMLEKPPGSTVAEIRLLAEKAERAGLSLFATWHSRHARGVEPARAWLADKRIMTVDIQWREDVRRWHPGQDWIFQPGGLGVFDPGVNALSIVTHILPEPFALRRSRLHVPQNRQAPILAELSFQTSGGAPIEAVFDFLQTGPQTWTIRIETEDGLLELTDGGAALSVDGEARLAADPEDALGGEYARLYERFAQLITARERDVDVTPLIHVADAFMLGERITAAPFHF